jgi:hypothetical protein
MANTATLADLRDACLKRCDLDKSSFIGRWEANSWINSALSELHDLIVLRYKQHYFKTGSITLVAGTESYALPADFAQMLAVYFVTAGVRYPLDEFMLPEFYERQVPLILPVAGDLSNLRWRTLGLQLYVVPKPSAAGTLELWYTPQFVFLVDPKLDDGATTNTAYSAGADVIEPQVFPGWEEFVIADFGVKAMTKQEADPSPFMAMKTAQVQRVERMSAQRNIGAPQRMVDVYRTERSGRLRMRGL